MVLEGNNLEFRAFAKKEQVKKVAKASKEVANDQENGETSTNERKLWKLTDGKALARAKGEIGRESFVRRIEPSCNDKLDLLCFSDFETLSLGQSSSSKCGSGCLGLFLDDRQVFLCGDSLFSDDCASAMPEGSSPL